MNIICNCGGDTDTNAAIVGCVIGPLIGFDNFGRDIVTFFQLKILIICYITKKRRIKHLIRLFILFSI